MQTIFQFRACVSACALAAGLMVWTFLTPVSRADSPDVTVLSILPSQTDSSIVDFNTPHQIYINRNLASGPETRNELLLWIPGTIPENRINPSPSANRREGAEAFCRLAAELGYHVISLRYPNSISASVARLDDADEFENFRMAIISGGTSKHITVERRDSIENRLIKLLQYLATNRPNEKWNQFLTDKSGIN